MELPIYVVEDSVRRFLEEDIGYGDITTNSIIDAELKAEGRIVCKKDAVIAGLREGRLLLELAGCEAIVSIEDGEHVKAGSTILSAKGPGRALLSIERTLLNLLSHMSGVASATSEIVSIVKKESEGRVRVACTRKTLPGLRYFEKRAVEIGGGDTHRLRLDDSVLIKDNHLTLSGSIYDSVRRARSKVSFTKKIEVEATSPAMAVEAASAGADIVLLDNMTIAEIERSISLLRSKGLSDKIVVEASGGITVENVASYAKTGVDVISVGAVTQSARAVDMSMEIRPSKKRS